MRNRILVAVAVFAFTAVNQSICADEAQIDIRGVQSGKSNLLAPLGGAVSDSGEPVGFMQAIVSDIGIGPFSISGGALSFTSPDPTSVDNTSFYPAYFNYYAAGGGTLTLTGSIFGLPDGSPLLAATFVPADTRPYGVVTTAFVDPTVDLVDFSGLLTVTWVNPVLLTDLGAAGFSPGFGSIGVTRYHNADTGSLDTLSGMTLSLTTPEPATALFLGTGLLCIVARCRSTGRRKTVFSRTRTSSASEI